MSSQTASRTSGIPFAGVYLCQPSASALRPASTMFAGVSKSGAEIIYPNPGFPIYESMIRFTGAEAVPFDSTEIWDPTTGEWSNAGTISTPRARHTAPPLGDGRVLVTGSVGKVASAEIWDPTGNTWSSAGSMSQWRAQHAATLLPDGRVIVTGGLVNGETTEIFDPATGAWSGAASTRPSTAAQPM